MVGVLWVIMPLLIIVIIQILQFRAAKGATRRAFLAKGVRRWLLAALRVRYIPHAAMAIYLTAILRQLLSPHYYCSALACLGSIDILPQSPFEDLDTVVIIQCACACACACAV